MNKQTSSLNQTSAIRNPGIDLLRGISIILVVIHHVGLRIPLKDSVLSTLLPPRVISSFSLAGNEAVFIFFVISGFLITSNSLARWGSLAQIKIRSFYARRASRILPCLIILIAVLSVLHLAGVEDYVIKKEGQSLFGAIFSALGLHLNWYEANTGYLPGNWDVLWSLSIEEVFYLGFPIVCILLRRKSILLPLLILFALSLPITRAAIVDNKIWRSKAYLPGMAGISMGVAGALIAEHLRHVKSWLIISLAAIGSLGIITAICFEDYIWPYLGNGIFLLLTASTISLLLAFYWQSIDGDPYVIPGTGWIRSFGRLSYEIYLTHMFIIWPVVHSFKTYAEGSRWGVLWYPPAIAISWLLGWFVAKFISIPSDRFLRQRFMKSKHQTTKVRKEVSVAA